jgi:polyhydroxyalkanoate synthesis regulator phasin
MIRTQITGMIERADIATKSDIRRLEERLDDLEKKLSM